MQWILAASVLLNGILAWKVLEKKEVVREEIVEKVIIKKSEPQIIEKKIIVQVPGQAPEPIAAPKEFDERDMEDSVENVVKAKEDFLVGKLGLTDLEFNKIESIKQRFYKRYEKVLPAKQLGSLTLEQRKAMLQLEEERDAEYARTLGPQKWKEWETYRESYNQKMYKKALKEKGAIVPMEF